LGGLYIGGGIAPKILPFLLDGLFLNAFVSKGRFKETLQNMQIKISLNPQTALLGAAHFGVDSFLKA
jgi:glucokinase